MLAEKRVATNSNTQWVRFLDCWEDRGASQDVKMNGMIGVSSLVRSRKCADERCTSTYYGDHVGPTR